MVKEAVMARLTLILLTVVLVGMAVGRRPEFDEWQAAERVGNLLLCPRNFPTSVRSDGSNRGGIPGRSESTS